MLIVRIRISRKELSNFIREGILTSLSLLLILLPTNLGSEYVSQYGGVKVPPLIADWQLITATIIQEAKFESLKGMTMVAEVIRDRTESRYNSDGTIPGTILRAKQFSGWNEGEDKVRIMSVKADLADNITQKAMYAYEDAFKNRTSYAMGANLYHADYMNPYPEWTKSPNVTRLTQEGHHIFYFEKR